MLYNTPMSNNTRWEDSGFDCTLCGGPIFKRMEVEEEVAGRLPSSYYQCQQCEAVWSLDQRLLSPGQEEKQYQRPTAAVGGWPWWVWLLLGLTLMFLLTRAGGIGALLLRYVVPLVFVAIVVWVLYRALRDLGE